MATLDFTVLYHDRGADRGLTNLGKTTEKTAGKFKAMKTVGVAAIAAIAVGVAKFGTDSVKAYVEAEKSQIRLQDAFRKFPKLSDTNIDKLNKLNSTLALKTKYDDDATASGQAVLAQFGLTGTEITKLTPLLQDYAAKTGKDLPTAAKDLGKATMGQGKALKNVGINFKDTGDKSKNLEQVMGGLRGQVGGFAEKEGKSAAGQADILKNQFGELQESAGKQLLPALLKVGGGLLKLVDWVGSLSPMFSSFKKIAVATFDAFTGSTDKGKSAFQRFSEFIETHQGDIVGGFVTAGKAVLEFAGGLATGLSAGLRAFGALSDVVGQFTSFSIDQFGLMLKAAVLSMGWMPGIGPKLKELDGRFTDFANNARDNIYETGDSARALADDVDGKLKPALDKAGRKLDEVGKKEIVKAKTRDAVNRAAIAVQDLGTKSDGSQIKLKKFSDRTKLSATEAKGLRDRLSGVKGALKDQLGAMKDAGAGQGKLSEAWRVGKKRLYDEFRQMGLSKDEAKKLAKQYAGVPPKVQTKVTQPGMKDARDQTKGLDDDINDLNGRSVNVRVMYSSTGTINLRPRAVKKGSTRGGDRDDFAVGGVLPGWSPGRDIHHFTSSTAGDLHLSGGEGILIPQATKAVGGRAGIKRINDAARAGRAFASGGVFRTIRVEGEHNAPPNVAGSYSSALANAEDWARSAASAEARRLARAEIARQKAAIKKAAESAAGGGDPGGPSMGGGRNRVSWKGGTFTERFRNTLIRAQRLAGVNIPVFQGGFSSSVAASGASHLGDAIDTARNGGILRGLRRARVAAWNRGPAQGFINHIHGIPLPGAGFAGGSGVWQAQDYLRGGDGLARGAVVRGGRGGVTTRIGEGRRDELVAPLPKNWENLVRVMERGGRPAPTVIYQVSFPNYVGDKADLKRALVDLNRGGHLDVIKRVA